MPSTTRNTREIIVDAATDLFYRKGFNATSYADIAELTGVGKGNIHYHFHSKDNILKAVIDARINNISNMLEMWSSDCDTPNDCLARFIDMVEQNAEELSRYGCPIGTLNDELGKNNLALQEAARQMFDLFKNWLEAHFADLESSSLARDHAEHLMAMVQGAGMMAHAYKDPKILQRQTANMRSWLAEICNAGPPKY